MAFKRTANLLALVLLLPAAQARAARSVMVFVVAEDKNAESSTAKMSQLVEDAVGKNNGYEVVDLRDASGEVVSGETRATKKGADADLEAGKKAFAEGQVDPAIDKFKSAVRDYESAAAGLEKVDGYVDALAYLAASLQLKGKEDDARDELVSALVIKPTYKPEGKLNGGAFLDLLKQARKEAAETHRGSASVFTVPSGGKVIVDGEVKGYAPVTIDRMPVGKHVFVFQKAGYLNGGQVAEVTSTDEIAIKGHFTPTKDFGDVEDAVAQASKEVASSSAGPATWKVLSKFKVDRAIFGNVRTSGDNLVLDLALVDAKAKRRISKRRNSFEGEEYGTLGREVGRLVSGLLSDADDPSKQGAQAKKGSRDPLDDHNGMEEWSEDDPGAVSGNASENRKKKGGDDDDVAPRKKKGGDDDDAPAPKKKKGGDDE